MINKHIKRLQRKLISYEYGVISTYLFFCFRLHPLTKNSLSFNHYLLKVLGLICRNIFKIIISFFVITILYLFYDLLANYFGIIKDYWS